MGPIPHPNEHSFILLPLQQEPGRAGTEPGLHRNRPPSTPKPPSPDFLQNPQIFCKPREDSSSTWGHSKHPGDIRAVTTSRAELGTEPRSISVFFFFGVPGKPKGLQQPLVGGGDLRGGRGTEAICDGQGHP